MSRTLSTLTLSVLLFLTCFTIFTSAAPTNTTCGGLEVESSPTDPEDVPIVMEDVPKVDNSTNPTVVDDDSDVVDLDKVSTLAVTRSGTATWYTVGLGACGYTDKDSDAVLALAGSDWGGGSHCNQKVQITNPKNGRVKTATVRDECPGCPSGNLDLSPSLFKYFADNLDVGVFTMTWQYV